MKITGALPKFVLTPSTFGVLWRLWMKSNVYVSLCYYYCVLLYVNISTPDFRKHFAHFVQYAVQHFVQYVVQQFVQYVVQQFVQYFVQHHYIWKLKCCYQPFGQIRLIDA